MHAYIHTYLHACMHTYIHTYMHAYIHVHSYILTYMHTYIHAYWHTYIHTYIHACIHTCIKTYIHAHTHTYIHTYKHHIKTQSSPSYRKKADKDFKDNVSDQGYSHAINYIADVLTDVLRSFSFTHVLSYLLQAQDIYVSFPVSVNFMLHDYYWWFCYTL
jgi:hypothetical protein